MKKIFMILLITCLTLFETNAEETNSENTCPQKIKIPQWPNKNKIIIFGESHGQKEVPELFFDVVCQTSEKLKETNKNLIVFLELPVEHNQLEKSVQNFLSSEGKQEDINKLLENKFWMEYKDGRSSVATFRLLENLRRLIHVNKNIKVKPFAAYTKQDSNKDKSIEQIFAETVEESFNKNNQPLSLLLVGSFHGNPKNPYSMGAILKPDVAYYHLASSGGSSWSCGGSREVQICEASKIKRPYFADSDPATSILTYDESGKVQQIINLGKVTASPPARDNIQIE